MLRVALGLLVATLATAEAAACSCAQTSRAEVIARSEVVFSGTVRRVGVDRRGMQAATVQVTQRIKGRSPGHVVVLTRRLSASCGYPMRRGLKRDFAGTLDARDRMTVSLCTMLPLNARQ